MTHRQAAATPSPTALNKKFYCPLCSCIALIDRTTTTLCTAFVFKAPCSESFSFFSFLAPFSFFHVTVTVTATSGTAQLPLRSRSPRTCSLHWWEHLFSSKTQNALLLPVPSPGAPIPQFSTIVGAGQIRAALGEPKARKAREGKENEIDALRVRQRKRKRASHAVGPGAGGGQESPKAAILVDLAPHLAVRPISIRG